MVHKALHRELMIEKHVPTKTRDELSCGGGKKQCLFQIRHSSGYSYYKTDEESRGLDSDYDNWNISMFICDTSFGMYD